MPKVFKKKLVPKLKERMAEIGATNESLSRASGVGMSTIVRAKTGPILENLADWITQALWELKFKKDAKGASDAAR